VTGAAKRERLARRRKVLGLTQEDLAGLLGVERSTVVRWERGETAPVPWIRPQLAEALQVSAEGIGELLDDHGPSAGGTGRSGGAAAVPRQLPATVPDFTGRSAELEELARMLDKADGAPAGTVVISAIGGTGGVGKTALALHWAHQVSDRFSDGQLYVNLRGYDPSGTPASPAEAVRGFLDALGVPPDKIPALPDAQAAMYRGRVADRKMLIVLDNARDEQQVRPLLPASSGGLVLVTSRSELTGLAVANGARLLSLDVLTHAEAVELLTARIGPERAEAEHEAVTEIASLCACLPLALAVAAARAAVRPGFPLASLAGELRDAGSRLDAFDSGDPSASVRAVFSWSYRQLDAETARLFRLLGLHPGPDISAPAAASLAGMDEPAARRALRELARSHLITEQIPGRYAFHDLLRVYAADQARARDSTQERAEAIGRVLDHYLHTARDGAFTLLPSYEPIASNPPRPGAVPERLTDYQQALAWFDAEYDVLVAAVTLAAGSGLDAYAWQIPWAMTPFLWTARQHTDEGATLRRTALGAALRDSDTRQGMRTNARTIRDNHHQFAEYHQVTEYFLNSLEQYRDTGDPHGEAIAHYSLAAIAEYQESYARALGHAERAFDLFTAIGDKGGQAVSLGDIGWYHALLGHYGQARTCCRQALAQTEIPRDKANIWDSLGYTERHLGNFAEAIACCERAISIFREIGEPYHEATVLVHLGDAHDAAGQSARAQAAWQQSLVILDGLGHPDAVDIRAKLAGLGH
jgi:tetratricopeptide (TPR) repeat protein/transcriptional regulator with XRE-family HTH domain